MHIVRNIKGLKHQAGNNDVGIGSICDPCTSPFCKENGDNVLTDTSDTRLYLYRDGNSPHRSGQEIWPFGGKVEMYTFRPRTQPRDEIH